MKNGRMITRIAYKNHNKINMDAERIILALYPEVKYDSDKLTVAQTIRAMRRLVEEGSNPALWNEVELIINDQPGKGWSAVVKELNDKFIITKRDAR